MTSQDEAIFNNFTPPRARFQGLRPFAKEIHFTTYPPPVITAETLLWNRAKCEWHGLVHICVQSLTRGTAEKQIV